MREYYLQIIVEGYQTDIKRFVVQRRKADAIFWIQSFSFIISPWYNVTCNEKFWNVNTSQCTLSIVICQNYLSEHVLINSSLNLSDARFTFQISRDIFELFFVFALYGHALKFCQYAFTFIDKRILILKEFIPEGLTTFSSISHAFDISFFEYRVT